MLIENNGLRSDLRNDIQKQKVIRRQFSRLSPNELLQHTSSIPVLENQFEAAGQWVKNKLRRYAPIGEDSMTQESTDKMALEAENLAFEIKNWLNGLGNNITSDEE